MIRGLRGELAGELMPSAAFLQMQSHFCVISWHGSRCFIEQKLKEENSMSDFRKLVKIAALDRKMPGPVCGDPDCEDLCAEAFDAA